MREYVTLPRPLSGDYYLGHAHNATEGITGQEMGQQPAKFGKLSRGPTPGHTNIGVLNHANLQSISSLQPSTTRSAALDIPCLDDITIAPAQCPYKVYN